MAFYFVCPGDVTVSDTTVQCSQTIATIDTPANAWLTHDDLQKLCDGVVMCIATLLVCYLIKKALDI